MVGLRLLKLAFENREILNMLYEGRVNAFNRLEQKQIFKCF